MVLTTKDTVIKSNFHQLLYQGASFDYNPVIKHATIYLPDRVTMDNLSFLAIDNNNIGFFPPSEENVFKFTAGAIAYGEAFKISDPHRSNMTGKIDLICGDYDNSSDLYGPTSDKYADPISVEIIGSYTGYQYYKGKLCLCPNKENDQWTLTSGEAYMVLEKGVTNATNSRGRMGDLNLLALILIFFSAGFNVGIGPIRKADRHIKKSFRKIRFLK
ncbi:MAG: hypothetical protein ABIA08_01345 [bacterium]